VAGNALGSDVAKGEGSVEGIVASADPVASRIEDVPDPFRASATYRRLNNTKNPPSNMAKSPTVAYRRERIARPR
jgi:hypothetical protein